MKPLSELTSEHYAEVAKIAGDNLAFISQCKESELPQRGKELLTYLTKGTTLLTGSTWIKVGDYLRENGFDVYSN